MPIAPWSVSQLRGPERGARSGDLFAYSSSFVTFTRSSEAAAVDPRNSWLWFSTTTPWPASDVPRIFADGAILVEGASTNYVLRNRDVSQAAQWTGAASGGTQTGSYTTGPDGVATIGTRLQAGAGQFCRGQTHGGGTGQQTISCYGYFVGAGPDNLAIWCGNGASGLVTALTATYARSSVSFASTSSASIYPGDPGDVTGGNPPIDYAIDLIQVEQTKFATSPIRTTTATVTRAIDVCLLAAGAVPSAIKAGRWAIDIWPTWATASAPSTAYIYYLDANNYLAIVSGATLRCRANGSNFDVGSLTFTAHAKRTVTVDFGADTLAIDGASSVALTNDWSGSSAALSIGSDGSANAFFGVLSRPRV